MSVLMTRSTLTETVRAIIQGAGEDGVEVRAFFNHRDLEGFTHSEIDDALRSEMNALNVALGGTATRFRWVA